MRPGPSGGATGDGATTTVSRARPVAIVAGLALSFALITPVRHTAAGCPCALPASLLRWLGLGALVLVGLAMLVPSSSSSTVRSRRSCSATSPTKGSGTLSGFVLGLALGAVFVPCAGPVLAAIAVAGATGTIGAETVLLTVAFAAGVSIPLLAFALAGSRISTRVRASNATSGWSAGGRYWSSPWPWR